MDGVMIFLRGSVKMGDTKERILQNVLRLIQDVIQYTKICELADINGEEKRSKVSKSIRKPNMNVY